MLKLISPPYSHAYPHTPHTPHTPGSGEVRIWSSQFIIVGRDLEPRYFQPRFGVFGVLDDVSGFAIGALHDNWSDADKVDRGPIL